MAASQLSYNRVFKKIQSSIPKYISESKTSLLADLFDSKLSEGVKYFVETAIRQFTLDLLNNDASTDLIKVKLIVKICIEGAFHEMCLPTLPILILSDAFDCITIDQCKELFEFVESIVAVLKEPLFFTPCKNQVLRMCNDVLRRLSRTQNTIFCGRILLFLARFFPFSERSGLNLISEFNLENVTSYASSDAEVKMEEAAEEDKTVQNRPSLDYTLYAKFWSLQDFFRNPVQCYQPSQWEVFSKYTDDVLEAFASFKMDTIQAQKTQSKGKSLSRTDSSDDQVYECFPKYLSSQKLLDLQFSDSNFRRFILVQMLILGQYLTLDIKFKQEKLNGNQPAWVEQMQEKAYALIQETPPNGKEFADIVQAILKKEKYWNDWKNVGCQEIKKPTSGLKRPLQRTQQTGKEKKDDVQPPRKKEKRKIGDVIKEAEAKKEFSMGNAEMTRLWNICPNNFESCLDKRRDFVPSLESYFTPAVEAKKKGDDSLVNNMDFGWRALRLLASKSPHFFTNTGNTIATLPEYLKTMIDKVAVEIPSTAVEEMKVDEEEKEEEIAVLNEGDKEEVDEIDEDHEDETLPRDELKAIDTAEMKQLSKVLANNGTAWRVLGKKIGFEDEEMDWFSQDKSVEDAIEIMLQRWVENEEDEANKENLIYTLEGLKLGSVVKAVYG